VRHKIYGGIRLAPVEPDKITREQQPLAENLRYGKEKFLQGFTTERSDGAMIGPFSVLLHFPDFGEPVWDLFLARTEKWSLPITVRETVILATGAAQGSLYDLYSHEATSRGEVSRGPRSRRSPPANGRVTSPARSRWPMTSRPCC
jgi:4-carboxymuconolactone decarboxylase